MKLMTGRLLIRLEGQDLKKDDKIFRFGKTTAKADFLKSAYILFL